MNKLVPSLSYDVLLHFCQGNRLLENLKLLLKNEENEQKIELGLLSLTSIMERFEK